jgi:Rho GDP-dissociation inhibitor
LLLLDIPDLIIVFIVTAVVESVDKLEQMLGSYGPSPSGEPYSKDFDPEESPSGMLARSGTYNVQSRVIDDDGEVYASEFCNLLCLYVNWFANRYLFTEWGWQFKLTKEW